MSNLTWEIENIKMKNYIYKIACIILLISCNLYSQTTIDSFTICEVTKNNEENLVLKNIFSFGDKIKVKQNLVIHTRPLNKGLFGSKVSLLGKKFLILSISNAKSQTSKSIFVEINNRHEVLIGDDKRLSIDDFIIRNLHPAIKKRKKQSNNK